MAFHEVQFPTDISYDSAGGGEFSTEVVKFAGGAEARNANWAYPLERWDVAYGVKTQALLDTLREFFYARQGRLHGFRFKNHDDYQGTTEPIGTGDDSDTTFQLVKRYTSGGYNFDRKITKPVSGTTHIFFGGAEQNSGWTVSTVTGIVTFNTPPTVGTIITATFNFDIPVRFDTDFLPIRLSTYQARAAQVPIVEIRV